MQSFARISFILLIVVILFKISAYAQDKPEPSAATVNGERILMSELDREMRNLLNSYPILGERKNIAELRQARSNILENLIKQELIIQEGRKLNLVPQDKEVEVEYGKIRQRFQSEEQFQEVLKQQGLTEKKLQDNVKRRMILMKVIDTVVKPTAEPVTDKDISDFYEANKEKYKEPEKVHASHILIKVETNATDQEKYDAEKRINEILQQVKSGSDFAELAKKHSQCPSASRGGDLGTFGRGQMIKEFEDAAFSTEVGQISNVVLTDFGYHIIKVQEKKPEKIMELSIVSDEIKRILTAEKMNTATEKWLQPLKDKSNIQIMVKG